MSKRSCDVLLINPGEKPLIYQALGNTLSALEPPVWAGLMASFLRVKGASVQILDANAEGLPAAAVAERVQGISPALVAVVVYGNQPSASTQSMAAASLICAAVKERSPGMKIILVGGHASALPERTLREEAADFVGAGEGPVTLWELLQALQGGRAEDMAKVPGLWWREGEAVRSNAAPPLIKELETQMPGVAWDLLPMHLYRAHNWHCFGDLQRQPYASIYTTLGCPFHCTFCCIQSPFKSGEKALGLKSQVNSYRFWSPKHVVDGIGHLVEKYGVRNIKFADEMFVLNLNHVGGICDEIIQRGYKLNIWAYTRVDTIKDSILEKLKKAGIHWLAFGIESASERVRDDVQKGFGQEEIIRTIRKVQEAGIHVIGNYIFGLPEDDLETMQETLDLALELNCEFANLYCAMAYPGSALYNLAVEQKWPLPKRWSGYSQHSVDSLPLPTKYLSAGEVLEFRDKAFHTYFSSPRYLEMIRQKFGQETMEHIREMSAIRLVRNNVPNRAPKQEASSDLRAVK